MTETLVQQIASPVKDAQSGPLLPEEIEAIDATATTPDDFVTTGFTKVNGRWYQCGSTPNVTFTDGDGGIPFVTPELPINAVADKLNLFEDLTTAALDVLASADALMLTAEFVPPTFEDVCFKLGQTLGLKREQWKKLQAEVDKP